MANWSDLHSDILEHLTSFLPIQDYHRFGAVCRNWHMVAKQKRYSPARQIPWLVLGEEKDSKKRKLYNLVEDRHYHLDVPELHGKTLCGSQYGWVFTLDRKLNFHLINPLTRDCYSLPPPPSFSECYFDAWKHELPLYLEAESDNEEAHGKMRLLFEELQRVSVFKAILDYDPSMRSDFTAVILYGEYDTPSFWRPGNNTWTDVTGLEYEPDRSYEPCDVTFFKGKFYTVIRTDVDLYSEIYTFEVGPYPQATKVELQVPYQGNPNYVMGYNVVSTSCLVILNEELLLVERFMKKIQEVDTRRWITTEFVVHKLDLEGRNYSTYCHIDGHAIFLGGTNSAVVISPGQNLNCMKDAIYFTDLAWGISEVYGAEDHGIYDMIGNRMMSYYPRDVFHHSLAAPTWLTPNPW